MASNKIFSELLELVENPKLERSAGEGIEYFKNVGKKGEETQGAIGTALRPVLRRARQPHELHDALIDATRKANEYVRKRDETIRKTLSDPKIDEGVKSDFRAGVIAGTRKQQWAQDAMKEQGFSKESIDLLDEYKKDSDLAYTAAAAADKEGLIQRGYKNTDKRGNIVKKVDARTLSDDRARNMVIKDIETDEIIKDTNIVKEKMSNGYELRQVLPRETHYTNYSHYLAKADTDPLYELPHFTFPYAEGGPLMYTKGTHFVKIGRSFYKENGETILGYEKTLVAGDDTKALQEFADEVNKSVQIFNENKDNLVNMERAIRDAKFKRFKVKDATELQSLMKSPENPMGLLDPNPKITNARVFRGDEKFFYDIPTKEGNGYRYLDGLEEYDKEMSELTLLQSQYYRSKGDDIIKNIVDRNYSHIVDPFEIWQHNIENYAYTQQLQPFYKSMADKFVEKYRSVIDTSNGFNPDRMSSQDVIATARIVNNKPGLEGLAREALRAQTNYLAFKNIPTKMDMTINDWFSNTIKTLPRSWWDSKAMDRLRETRPADVANAIVFRNYLGAFNINQLWKNGALPIMNTVWTDPLHGARAVIASPLLAIAHYHGHDKFISKAIDKLAQVFLTMKSKDFKDMLAWHESHGTFNQMFNRAELTKDASKWTANHWDGDLIFLKTGNNLAQLVADTTAYLRFGKTNPERIAGYADDLMQNTNRLNNSRLQQSAMGKVVSLFTSYPVSALETLTNTRFSPFQRFMFAIGQLYMFGVGGTFARDQVTNLYNWADQFTDWFEEKGIDSTEWMKNLIEGHVTSAFAQSGYDVRDGLDFAGMFNQMLNIVPGLGDPESMPIASIRSVIADNYNLVRELLFPTTGTRDFLSGVKTIATRYQHAPTSLRSFSRSALALMTKRVYDKHGDYIKSDADLNDAFMYLLGFKPIEGKRVQMEYETQKYGKEYVEDVYTNIVKPWADKIKDYNRTDQGRPEDDTERHTEYARLREGLTKSYREAEELVKRFDKSYLSLLRNMKEKDIRTELDKYNRFFMTGQERAVHEKVNRFIGEE